MPLFGARMSPKSFEFVFLTKGSVGDYKVVLSAYAMNSTGIDVPNAILAYSAIPKELVLAKLVLDHEPNPQLPIIISFFHFF